MKTAWKQRTLEWIKANPKQGTMYKVYLDEQGNELSEIVKKQAPVIIPLTKEQELKAKHAPHVPDHLFKPNEYGHINTSKIKKYEGSPKIRGVYVIICEAEKHAYIGQSFNVPTRLRNHKMCIVNGSTQQSYKKMQEHYKRHKIEAFQFIDYEYIDNATEGQLLKREAELMTEFAKMGYKLYNRAFSKELIDSSIFCPDNIRGDIERLIDYIRGNSDKAQQLTMFIDSLKP